MTGEDGPMFYKLNGRGVAAGVLAFLVTGIANVQADDVFQPNGMYSIYENGKYFTSATFSCIGQPAPYCANINFNALNQEERDFFDNEGDSVGDLTFTRSGDKYEMTGSFYVSRTCTLSTSRVNSKPDAKEKTVCSYNEDKTALNCTMYEPSSLAEEQVSALPVIVKADGSGGLSIIYDGVQDDDNYALTRCFEVLADKVLRPVDPDELNHNLYISRKIDFLRTDGDLNELWKQLPKSSRKKILPEQREWIKKKDKQCGEITMKGTEKELSAMYKCQSEFTEKRVEFLEKSYLGQ